MNKLLTIWISIFLMFIACVDVAQAVSSLNQTIITQIAWSPSGDRIAIGNSDGQIDISTPETNIITHHIDAHSDDVFALGWSPDGFLLASGGLDGHLKIWDTITGEILLDIEPSLNPKLVIFDLDWNSDGTQIVFSTNLGLSYIYKLANNTQTTVLYGHKGIVSTVDWSDDDLYIATGGWDDKVLLWNPQTGERLAELVDSNQSLINDVKWKPKTSLLVVGSADGNIRIWDAQNYQLQQIVLVDDDSQLGVLVLDWSHDGKSLISGDGNGTITVWDATNFTIISANNISNAVWKMALRPVESSQVRDKTLTVVYSIQDSILTTLELNQSDTNP